MFGKWCEFGWTQGDGEGPGGVGDGAVIRERGMGLNLFPSITQHQSRRPQMHPGE